MLLRVFAIVLFLLISYSSSLSACDFGSFVHPVEDLSQAHTIPPGNPAAFFAEKHLAFSLSFDFEDNYSLYYFTSQETTIQQTEKRSPFHLYKEDLEFSRLLNFELDLPPPFRSIIN